MTGMTCLGTIRGGGRSNIDLFSTFSNVSQAANVFLLASVISSLSMNLSLSVTSSKNTWAACVIPGSLMYVWPSDLTHSAVGLVSDVLVSLVMVGSTPDDLVGSKTSVMLMRCLFDLKWY